jgi:hypothetical protein
LRIYVVLYTPPYPNFEGEDDFTFRVSNVAARIPQTATVRVFVVAPPTLTATCLYDRIVLVWSIDSALQNMEDNAFIKPFADIYRYDGGSWHLIHSSDFDERAYADIDVRQGNSYQYRIQLRLVDVGNQNHSTVAAYSNQVTSSPCPSKPMPIGLVTGNDADGTIRTYNFLDGTETDFFPQSAAQGRGLAIEDNKIYYSGVTGFNSGSDGIHICPYGPPAAPPGFGGPEIVPPSPFSNPDGNFGIQDLAFHSNVLYVMTGYLSHSPRVDEIDPSTGQQIPGTSEITVASPPAGLGSDGFTVLPSGNFLINGGDNHPNSSPGDASPAYHEYSGADGALVPGGLTIRLTDYGFNAGTGVALAPDQNSLYFMAHVLRGQDQLLHNTLIRTDLSGQLIGFQPVGDGDVEDIEVVFP